MLVLAGVPHEGPPHVSVDAPTGIGDEGMPPAMVRWEFLVSNAKRTAPVRHPLPDLLRLRVTGRSIPFARLLEKQGSGAGCNRLDDALLQKMGVKHDVPCKAALLRTRVADYTVHGFRTSFSTWAAEQTDFPRDLVEHALAHLVGSDVERAYRHRDGLEKRGTLMQAWADHAFGIL